MSESGSENDFSSGNEQLTGEIWRRLYRYIYYQVQNHEEAEELTQETFKRVQPKLIAGEINEGKVEAYYFTAAKNLLSEVWRNRIRRPVTLSMDKLVDGGWEPALPPLGAEVEDALLLREALQRLSDDYRRVLTLRIIEGLPVNRVAPRMKRNPGAIRALQFRAIRALKEELAKGGYFHE